jgi:glycosyltransferase involved in cell wall biosynthesis
MFVINSVVVDGRVIKEASSLVAAGHEVEVIGMWDGGVQPRRETLEGFKILRVRRDPVRRDIGPGGGRGGRFRASVLGPLELAWGLLDYSVRALRAGIRGRVDAYHAHDLVTLPVAWAASRWRRAWLVYDAHELFTEIGRIGSLPRVVLRLLERLLIGRADRVMTVNPSIAAELARRYGVPEPVVLMNCPRTVGVAADRPGSGLRSRVGLAPEVPIALYQGMFFPHRGLENLVEAARHFHRAHLVFMGWGVLREALERLAREKGISGRVVFTEGVPLRDLLSFTAGADVGLIPYRNVGLNNYYTSPNKLFEYCAAGVPVAASRFPELVRVVEGMDIGRTFDPERPEEIAAAVNAIVDDPYELARFRENASRAGRQFTWENESKKLIDVYAALGGERGA